MNSKNWERFTQRARRALSLAQEEAEWLNQSSIGSEHVLIGLLREEGSFASGILRRQGLDVGRVRVLVESMSGTGTRTPFTKIDLSPSTKRILEYAIYEARRMGHNYISTEHLLLGLVRQNEGVLMGVLHEFGISVEQLRWQTENILVDRLVSSTEPASGSASEQVQQLTQPALEESPVTPTEPESKPLETTTNLRERIFVISGAAFMFLGVAAGAFGSHGLSNYFASHPDLEGTYDTAVRYQLIHGLALLAVAWAATRWPGRLTTWSGYLFAAGIVIFSGSLYLLVLLDQSWLGAITPLGGAAFLGGWLLLLIAAAREGRNSIV